MKHTLCDLQEKIFHLQIQLLEEDMAGGKSQNMSVYLDILFSFQTPEQLLFSLSSTGAKTTNTHTVWKKPQLRNG